MIIRLLLAAAACLLGPASLRAAGPNFGDLCSSSANCADLPSDHLDADDMFSCPECDDVRWYLQSEALILHRSNGSLDRAIVLADDTGDPILGTHDPDFNFQAGPRILLGRRTGADRGWELSYFGAHFWNAGAAAASPNNLDIPGPLVALANDFDNADQMRLTYASQLHNAELNLFRDHAGWSLLAGFRYLNLGERFNINSADSDGDVSDYTVRTSNHLFGGQLGARVQGRLGERIRWELVGKGGVFGNAAEQRLLLQDNDNTFDVLNTTARRGQASFVGDVSLSCAYELNNVWSLRGGYYVMYAAGLALAPDQLDFSFDLDTGTRIGTHGDLLLHGALVGLEARW